MIKYYYKNGFGWFRILGRGFAWKNTLKHELLFSERYSYTKGLKIGKWYFNYLGG
jgi:hypothetical protein